MAVNGKTDTKDEAKKPDEPKEERIQTKHSVVIDGQKIAYTATAGTLAATDADAAEPLGVLPVW